MSYSDFPVTVVKRYKVCDKCRGLFKTQTNLETYMSSPPLRSYRCNKCGIEKMLFQEDWPQIVFLEESEE